MAKHTIKKGLNLPITGQPEQVVSNGPQVKSVALVADDYAGMRPRMLIKEGDSVRRGEKLFEDRKRPGVFFTAPGAGTVSAINRGARRVLQTVVIELTGTEASGAPEESDFATFAHFSATAGDNGETARALLVESGLWTAIRTRPYGKVPLPDSVPQAIFVTAMDTNPLAPSVETVLGALDNGLADFEQGLAVLSRLTEGKVYLCKEAGSSLQTSTAGITVEEFSGPHPAGTAGVHINTLEPVHRNRTVWSIGYQDVVAIGHLFRTGKPGVQRVVSLAGPVVKKPRLVITRLGANLAALTAGELADGDNRVISGSVFNGRNCTGEADGYLGRYHNQVTALAEGRGIRPFIGWAMPGFGVFSTIPAYFARLIGKKSFALTTLNNGGERAMVPIGMYEKVMPMDILPTFLLRALASGDVERAEALGCLELDEEDLALCTFVCPSKIDYGQLLRDTLTQIEKES